MALDAAKIKHKREALKLSQEQAGIAAGWGDYAKQRWNKIERGHVGKRPTFAMLEAIAKVLRCKPRDLLKLK